VELYSEDLTADQRKKIIDSLNKAVDETGYRAKKLWERRLRTGKPGDILRVRSASAFAEKEKWDPDFTKRKKITAILKKLIPSFPSVWAVQRQLM